MLLPLLMQLQMLGRDTHDGFDAEEHRKREREAEEAFRSSQVKIREALANAYDPPVAAIDEDEEDVMLLAMYG